MLGSRKAKASAEEDAIPHLGPGPSPEVLAKAQKLIIDYCATEWSGITHGLALNMDGKEIAGRGYGACHAWVSHTFRTHCFRKERYCSISGDTPYPKGSRNFMTLSCHSKKKSAKNCSAEAHEALIMWMAKESPMSKFILNRDDDESLKNGGVIILCGPDGATDAQTLWICKVLRYAVEGKHSVDVWYDLVQAGVKPMLALYVCNSVAGKDGQMYHQVGVDMHCSVFVSYSTSADGWGLKMLRPTLLATAEATNQVFTNPKDKRYAKLKLPGANFANFCKPIKKPDGWGGEIQAKGVPKDEFIKRVLEWQAQLLKLLDEADGTPVPPSIPVPDATTVYLDGDL